MAGSDGGGNGVCASCGAGLPGADPLGLITCTGCGSVTKLAPSSGSGWPAPPVAAPPPSQWAAPAPVAGAPTEATVATARAGADGPSGKRQGRSSTKSRTIGCSLGPIVAFIAVGFGVISVLRGCDTDSISQGIRDSFSTESSAITLSGSGVILPAGKDGNADIAAVVQTYEDSNTVRRIARLGFSDAASTVKWSSEPLGRDAYRAEIAVVGDTLFAGVEDQLLALDAATGATRWKTTMRDKVTVGCAGCFAAVQGRLVVRTTDAYVTGYGTASNEVLWSRRLNSPGGSISVARDRLFVVDDGEDAGAVTPVALVDAANGKTIRTTSPTCPSNEAGRWALELSPGDEVRPVPGSTDVLAAFGFGDGCVVRWNPATGATVWTSRLTGLSSFEQEDVAVGRTDLVLANRSGQMVTIFLPNGKAKLLAIPADTTTQVGVIVGRTAVAYTATTRGTPRGGLAAWDLSTGQRLWAQSELGTAQPVSKNAYGSSDALFDGSPRSLLVPFDGGVRVFVFEGTEGTFSVSPVSLDTGRLGTTVRRAFLRQYDSGGTPSLLVEGVDGDRLVISIDSLLQTLPISGRGDVVSYPNKD